MEHREKLRQARRMMSKDEVKRHVSPFLSVWWTERKWQRHIKMLKKVKNKVVTI